MNKAQRNVGRNGNCDLECYIEVFLVDTIGKVVLPSKPHTHKWSEIHTIWGSGINNKNIQFDDVWKVSILRATCHLRLPYLPKL